MRREFEPTSVTLVIVAKSPPTSGKYFYDPDGKVSEPLFNALMKQLGIQPKTKFEGLREFQKRGWVLVDATYEPVNAHDKRDRGSRDRRGTTLSFAATSSGCWLPAGAKSRWS